MRQRAWKGGAATRFRLVLYAASSVLAGCTVGPDYQKPEAWWHPGSWFGHEAPVPKVAQVPSEPVAAPVDPSWWRMFDDPQLTVLESQAAAANLDVRLASIRLEESRAQLGVAKSDEMPTLTGSASYTRERLSQRGVLGLLGGGSSSNGSFGSTADIANGTSAIGQPPASVAGGTVIPPFNLFQYGFDASWEIDFWGRARREVEGARASVLASEDDRRDALLTVLAEVARDYVQLRGIQRNIEITQANLTSETATLKLTRERAAGGLTTDLDVANQQAQVASTASQIPNLQQQEAELINALSFLVAQPPKALVAQLATTKPIPPVPARVPVGLPSELARRRPDIREAEQKLHSATANIGVAVADFYPRVTLSGSIGLQALMFKDLGNWESRQYGFGPSVTLPLFEGGKLKATLELRKQQEQEAAITYQKTVLQAFHDVDNALTAYDAEQRRRAQLQAAVAANRNAVGLSRQRYDQGIATFLDVLDAQRQLLSTEQQLAQSTTTVSTDLVQLYKALGGGWEEAYPDDARLAQVSAK